MPVEPRHRGSRWRTSRRRAWTIGLLAIASACAWAFRPLLRGEVPAGRDLVRLFVPNAALIHDALSAGELPWWNPHEGLGRAFVAQLYPAVFYPPQPVFAVLLSPWRAVTAGWLLHLPLAGTGVFALSRALGRSRFAATVAGAAFALSPLLSTLAWQANVMWTTAWSGWLLWCSVRLWRRPTVGRVAALSAVMALAFLCGSPETIVWEAIVLVVLLAFERPRPRALVAFACAALLGIGLVSQTLLPGLELASLAKRVQPEEALRWSMSAPQLSGALLPGAELPFPKDAPYYTGDQRFLSRVYLGLTLVACAALAGFRRRTHQALLTAGVLLTLLSLGSHFAPSEWMLLHSPLVRFRYPAKYFVGAAFCAAVLASAGLDRLRARARAGALPSRRWIIRATLLGLIIAVPIIGLLPLRAGAPIAVLWGWALLSGTAVGLTLAHRRAAWVLGVSVWLDLGAAHLLLPPAGWAPLRDLERPSRFAALLGDDAGRVSIRTDAPGDRDEHSVPVTLSRDILVPNTGALEHVEQFETYGAPTPPGFARFDVRDRSVFDLCGVTHYVRRSRPFADLHPVAEEGEYRLDRSTTAFPRAFVVNRAVRVPDKLAADAVLSPSETTREVAYLASGAPVEGTRCPDNRAERLRAGWNAETWSVHTCRPGYWVESMSFYPGFEATVDGAPAPVERADLALRAVPIPPGDHQVTLTYRPAPIRWGTRISEAALVLWALSVLAALNRRSRLAP